MPAPIQLTSDALRGDIRDAFLDQYTSRRTAPSMLSAVMDDLDSTQRTERYMYWEESPTARIWRRGDVLPAEDFRSRSYSVTNYDWAVKVNWHENDAADDQTGSLLARARRAGRALAFIPERCFFQILTAGTDADLLPSVPNAPDGAALFSATDGAGANRFGVSGGNLYTQTGTTSQAIRDDFYGAMERMGTFTDPNSEPFHIDDLASAGFVILYPKTMEQQMREAFEQRQTLVTQAVSDGGGGATGTAAAVSNVVLDSGLGVQLWSSARLSGTAFYVFARGHDTAPIFHQVRMAVETDEEDRSNSDRARDTRYNSFQAFMRGGFGVNQPVGAIKVA